MLWERFDRFSTVVRKDSDIRRLIQTLIQCIENNKKYCIKKPDQTYRTFAEDSSIYWNSWFQQMLSDQRLDTDIILSWHLLGNTIPESLSTSDRILVTNDIKHSETSLLSINVILFAFVCLNGFPL